MDVVGPLLVISERVGTEPPRQGSEDETRRVLIYDLAEDRYWTAFDYQNPRTQIGSGERDRSAVRPAGTSIIVWSGDQVRRMSLNGETQAILFEDDEIRAIQVSPDGAKVAILHGEPGTLLVLDAHDGAEVLRVASDHPALGTLQGGGRYRMLNLGDWRDDSGAVSVTARDHSGHRAHTAVLVLDGTIRVLEEGLVVSPNLRYAIKTGESIYLRMHDDLWESLAVLDADTGRVVWMIAGQSPDHRGRIGVQRADVWANFSPAWHHLDDSRLWLGSYVAFSDRGGWVLDTETGEILPLTPDIEREIEGPVRSTCGTDNYYPQHGPGACFVQHEEWVVWEGAIEWTRYLGMIEVPGSLELRGIEPVAVVRDVLSPPPPARDEIVGPLFAYEVHGEYEYRLGDGRPDALATRRVIVYDEGTGRGWLAFAYPNWFAHAYVGRGAAQPALGGFVAEIDFRLVHFRLDGQNRTLYERKAELFHVSPDRRKLATHFYGGSVGPAYVPPEIVVLDLASGDEIVRYVDDELPAALGLSGYWSVHADGWTADSAAILLRLSQQSGTGELDDVDHAYHVLVDLDGDVRLAAMDRATYFARLARPQPPSRATTDCAAHPAKPCDILLDGEVIGEGRWPRIIGFIELD